MADTVPLVRQVVTGDDALPGEVRVIEAAERVLSGERRGVRAVLPFLGPAFIAAVAYIDPGNFATDMAGGSQFGYMLLWVVLAANLMAVLVQSMSAKLGIAAGRSLPEVCRDRFPFRVVVMLWLQAEAVAMATDLAEFVGAALGLHLVFGLSLWVSAGLTGVATFTILGMQVRGFRRLEATLTGLVAVVVLAFGLEMLRSRPSVSGMAHGLFVPQVSGSGSALLAVSIVGATVMPHVIYLHSSLTQNRIVGANPDARRKIFRFEMVDIAIAMGVAGVINLAMLATAAAVFHARGLFGAGNDLGVVFNGLNRVLGAHSGLVFGLALLASGLASSCVGTMSGQVVMQGFIHRRIPIFARRAITMIPALVLIGVGFSPTRALVLSQVFLSFGIPFALIPLLFFTSSRSLMGSLVNRPPVAVLAGLVTALIVGLNVYLLSTAA
ncbi:MAG TPA: Nramp family divalent metal transporter [Streptosporangiaceae bacterium]|nr:Nramp family divalent metal transporter [Streptosporangiaceae bacterium]